MFDWLRGVAQSIIDAPARLYDAITDTVDRWRGRGGGDEGESIEREVGSIEREVDIIETEYGTFEIEPITDEEEWLDEIEEMLDQWEEELFAEEEEGDEEEWASESSLEDGLDEMGWEYMYEDELDAVQEVRGGSFTTSLEDLQDYLDDIGLDDAARYFDIVIMEGGYYAVAYDPRRA